MSEKIPFVDLSWQREEVGAEIDAAVARVLGHQRFILGDEVEAFERAFEAACGLPEGCAVGVSSGTDALLAALMAAGVGPGDRVLTTPFSFFATVGTILRLGARPVFLDLDPATCNLDVAALDAHDPDDCRAIVPVHLYGRSLDVAAIERWRGEASCAIVEDAAQAVLARSPDGRPCGGAGDFGCFSFFPTKNLGGAGDGGMVVARDADQAEALRRLRAHGGSGGGDHDRVGGNFRLDAIQAAVLGAKLPHLRSWNERRLEHATRYDELIRAAGLEAELRLPVVPEDGSWNAHQYVIRSQGRDALRARLGRQGIGTAIYYPRPFHLMTGLSGLGLSEGDLPEAEAAAREVLALPIQPGLTSAQQERIVLALADFHAR